jgi:DNA replication protein DnaC
MKKPLSNFLKELRLPAFVANYEEMSLRAEKNAWGFEAYLEGLATLELAGRKARRIERNLKVSQLPLEKTLETLELTKLPDKVTRAIGKLRTGEFVERAENVLAFGLPGRGKTHVVCAIGQELALSGYRVLFIPAYRLVQRLLLAKRDLLLEKELRRLDRFDVVILDDLGYIQQDRSEMEVLFTFLAERYERRSVMITSNLVFSKWEQIFKDPMTTAAVIDRLVHHCTILELTGKSYRLQTAKEAV